MLTHVRLQLCEPQAHPYLLKALWGMLMLLPQSPAYHTLKNRLSAVPELGLLRLQLANVKGDKGGSQASGIDFEALWSATTASRGKEGWGRMHTGLGGV